MIYVIPTLEQTLQIQCIFTYRQSSVVLYQVLVDFKPSRLRNNTHVTEFFWLVVWKGLTGNWWYLLVACECS